MVDRVQAGTIQVDRELYNFINDEALQETGINSEKFWVSFSSIIDDLIPTNRELLDQRDDLQNKIDDWYKKNAENPLDLEAYKNFLKEIGYIVSEGDDFSVDTKNVDEEISLIAGPQLVVPVTNARYSLNAANARWGSLYDALYGTDAISEENGAERTEQYNDIRGKAVISFARDFLDLDTAAIEVLSWPSKYFATVHPLFSSYIKFSSGTTSSSRYTIFTSWPPSSVIIGLTETPEDFISNNINEIPS